MPLRPGCRCHRHSVLRAPLPPLQVGRHRPDFVARCWPDGGVPRFTPEGRPACAENAVDPDEGRKSFPSGAVSVQAKLISRSYMRRTSHSHQVRCSRVLASFGLCVAFWGLQSRLFSFRGCQVHRPLATLGPCGVQLRLGMWMVCCLGPHLYFPCLGFSILRAHEGRGQKAWLSLVLIPKTLSLMLHLLPTGHTS